MSSKKKNKNKKKNHQQNTPKPVNVPTAAEELEEPAGIEAAAEESAEPVPEAYDEETAELTVSDESAGQDGEQPETAFQAEVNPEDTKEESPAVISGAPQSGKPLLRYAAAFAGILAAAGLVVSTAHVLTRDAVRINEQNAFMSSFSALFPEASSVKEYTDPEGRAVFLAVHDGKIIGYCLEQGGRTIGYDYEGNVFEANAVILPSDEYAVDLEAAAIQLGLMVEHPETIETSANEDNGNEEIVIGEATEEGSETAVNEETEESEMEIPYAAEPESETSAAAETEPVQEPEEPDVPAIAEPAETEPDLPQVPEVIETEIVPETEPEAETEGETYWTPPETESQEYETDAESVWGTPETDPVWSETEAENDWPESETAADDENISETYAESSAEDSEPTETDPVPEESGEETEADETEDVSVEIEVEIEIVPEESETEEPETEETEKAETKKLSGSGLFG